MKPCHVPLFAGLLILAGCAKPGEPVGAAKTQAPPTQEQAKKTDPAPADPEAKIKAALAKLGDDREAAEAQRFCAVNTKNRLGTMGRPPKITIKNAEGEQVDVFLCCSGCETEARKDEAKTAARVFDMIITNSLAKLSPEDRKAAEEQKFCASSTKSRLGSMDVPTKVMVKDKDGKEHPVFFCCGGCERIIKKEGEEKVLEIVADLKKKNPPAPK